jgi:hypothetical protein
MTGYRYLGRWNYLLNKPIGSQGWIDEAEAQRRYETGGDFFTVVDTDAGVGVAPKFVLAVSPSRVTVGGRLFQWITVNFEYPDESTKYAMDDSTLTVRGKTEPNGDGFLTINDKSKPTVEKISFHDIPVDDLWLPVPKFGEWQDLTTRTPGDAHHPSAAQS